MKKRWISLFVENEVGMLAKISGLFSGKSYNLQSLTVGETEDPTVSRMTIGLISDDITFEQIKKQLNRSVGIIKVIDFTDTPIHMKEILFVKVKGCNKSDREEVFRIAQVFGIQVTDYGKNSILLESTQTEVGPGFQRAHRSGAGRERRRGSNQHAGPVAIRRSEFGQNIKREISQTPNPK